MSSKWVRAATEAEIGLLAKASAHTVIRRSRARRGLGICNASEARACGDELNPLQQFDEGSDARHSQAIVIEVDGSRWFMQRDLPPLILCNAMKSAGDTALTGRAHDQV